MRTFKISVTRFVTVRIDENKLTPLMPEYNRDIADFGFGDEAMERHAKCIAEDVVTGIYDFTPSDFVEGYGVVRDAGIDVAVASEVICENVGGAA